jgi:sortase A
LDGLLLIVEVAAVVGLIYVLYNGTTILEQLNREAQQLMSENVQALPTIGPTPMVVAVVLPSGHTPPDKLTGLSQPNDNEIPANLRPLVQAMPPPVVPTQGPSQANRIVIPAINVDAQIVQGDGWEQLKKGVGQHIGTADPGQPGNMVLSAHNDIYGEIFRQLDQLKPGDEIQVQTTTQVYNYVVSSWRVVPPTDVSALSPTAHPSLTLISCYPYLVDTERIVVTADLKTQ